LFILSVCNEEHPWCFDVAGLIFKKNYGLLYLSGVNCIREILFESIPSEKVHAQKKLINPEKLLPEKVLTA
jgi:hypothetical protein